VTELVIELIVVVIMIAAPAWCLARGLRNGDRPADVTVTAVLRAAGQPDEPRPVTAATVCNPSAIRFSRALRPARSRRLGHRRTPHAQVRLTTAHAVAEISTGPAGSSRRHRSRSSARRSASSDVT
jgi:hypothetical protein